MDFAHITIMGNLGRDPEVKVSAQGGKFARLSVAINKQVKTDEGFKPETVWYEVVCFGKTAEALEKFAQKGSKVLVTGKPEPQTYTDKSGNLRHKIQVIATDVVVASGKKDQAQQGGRDDETDLSTLPF
ncbi:Ssb Single-stranded DNA-binding protein [uncultured Caudovirales phage]|uniref:Single-stranded DNA-binding protein n=1 Tax=uncultured Caudovirales phage TaxID=2100421 RepID=A0A6J5N3G5_9CAUD|nr:Ssb Single-stranded DNA-binding protein [uncultured Caudovirales phage]